ncbi:MULTISPECIES: TetR/AcrR family transcriptional regulator [Mycobacterium]|uniref:TetR/AcrR family transcriptional regulator n=1 Tax=Mycobacterium TaxID=1763 RepID=UPI000EA9AA8C|nr:MULTISPECIES: TetR/AcrR family transcriptional regulator [Mycobacterium]MCG7606491.1 TetR/AcrR family transcriptional regulator [Mycobacterium sp. CnD-18-1]
MGPVGRPNRQAQRREEILDAATALIERNDLTTLRIADVAAELRLTPNAVRYYFREMDQLLSALAQRSDSRFYDDRLAVVQRTADARDQIAFMIAAGLPSGPEDAEWRTIWRAVLAAGFVLDQRPDIQHIFHRQVGLYTQILEAGCAAGTFTLAAPAQDIAMTLMSMEDYLGYRIVARDPDLDRATALRLMRGYAELTTGASLPVPT